MESCLPRSKSLHGGDEPTVAAQDRSDALKLKLRRHPVREVERTGKAMHLKPYLQS